MKIQLTKDEQNILSEIISKFEIQIGVRVAEEMTLDDDLADEIRNKCGEHLLQAEFDKNYEPTDKGKVLEALMNKLYL